MNKSKVRKRILGFGEIFIASTLLLSSLLVSLLVANTPLFASITGSNAGAINSDPLILTQTDNGHGFTTPLIAFAPGETVNRFVDYRNNGIFDKQNLTLTIADAMSSSITADGDIGIHVTVSSCSLVWNPATGTCNGNVTTLGSSSAFALKSQPLDLFHIAQSDGTPRAIAGEQIHLKFALHLPDRAEVTKNGVLPAQSIQGSTASITWILTQR